MTRAQLKASAQQSILDAARALYRANPPNPRPPHQRVWLDHNPNYPLLIAVHCDCGYLLGFMERPPRSPLRKRTFITKQARFFQRKLDEHRAGPLTAPPSLTRRR